MNDSSHPRGFASDNVAGIHPEVLTAISDVNHGHVVAYGDDPVTAAAVTRMRELLGDHIEIPCESGDGGEDPSRPDQRQELRDPQPNRVAGDPKSRV